MVIGPRITLEDIIFGIRHERGQPGRPHQVIHSSYVLAHPLVVGKPPFHDVVLQFLGKGMTREVVHEFVVCS